MIKLFIKNKHFWNYNYAVFDETGREIFNFKSGWLFLDVQVFDGLDSEPSLIVRNKPGFNFFSKVVIQDRNCNNLAEIVESCSLFPFKQRFKLRDPAGNEALFFETKWNWRGFVYNIYFHDQLIGSLYNKEFTYDYFLELEEGSQEKINSRMAVAVSAFLIRSVRSR